MSDRITAARATLHAVLAGGDTLPASRTHLYPQHGQYVTPCAWVGYPEVRADDRRSRKLTLPVVIAVDGAREPQTRVIDAETARLFDALDRVKIGGQRVRVTGSQIQPLGPEGSTLLGVVLSVDVDVITPTFCDASVADPS